MGKMCSTCAVAFSCCHGRVPYLPTAGHSDFLTAVRACIFVCTSAGSCLCLCACLHYCNNLKMCKLSGFVL